MRTSKRKKGLVFGIIGAAVVVALVAVFGLYWLGEREAQAAFEEARAEVQVAQLDHEAANAELTQAFEAAAREHAQGTALNAMTSALLLSDRKLKTSLNEALAGLAVFVEGDATPVAGPLDIDLTAPAGREALLAGAEQLRAQVPTIAAAAAEVREQTAELQGAIATSRVAAVALVQSAHEKALTFDVPSLASSETRETYLKAVDALGSPADGADLVALMQAYEDTWHEVVVSNEAGVRARGYENVTPTYLRGVLIVNKTYPLPESYGNGLTDATSKAYEKLRTAAASDGVNLWIVSGFRSYGSQSSIWYGIANAQSAAVADLDTARPGHSEHQAGLAIDVNSITEGFADTREGKWVKDNAHRYGFVIRYPRGKTDITGYVWEPWHLRYVGTVLAGELYESGLTLEEYLGVTSSYN